MTSDYFGEGVAEHYDDEDSPMFAAAVVRQTVERLAELADGGPALEFGVGTGRIAIPLSAAGIDVHGVDLSAAMLAQLRAKPGGERVVTAAGDFAGWTTEQRFTLVYLVYNTLGNLTTQDQQVACFANAAAHLRAGGRFVIEINVPDLQGLPRGERLRPFDVSPTHLGIDEYEIATQGLISHHQTLRDGVWQARSIPFRYVWPAELDLMARLAGMSLEHRWGDWNREPFTSASAKHVSVWRAA